MVSPTTTLSPTLQHPPPESITTTDQKQPPPPPSGDESEAPPTKGKLEEIGFHRSPYYTIRETVANLRGRFLQVCQRTDPQKKDAAAQILKEINDIMELSKKTQLDLSSAGDHVKPAVTPAARAPKDKPDVKVSSADNSQVHPISLAGNFVTNSRGDVPLEPDNSDTAAHSLLAETNKNIRPSKIPYYTKQQGELPQGSYVVGGSPIGWNYLMWSGSKTVYYGLTRAE